jgi:hypothetical protein
MGLGNKIKGLMGISMDPAPKQAGIGPLGVLCRIMYQDQCEASTDTAEYHSPFDDPETMIFIGYPETDAHFRQRLQAHLEGK